MAFKLFNIQTILGIGIGFIISAVIVGVFPPQAALTNKEIIEQARELGMKTEEEYKAALAKAKAGQVPEKSSTVTKNSGVKETTSKGATDGESAMKEANPKEPKASNPTGNETDSAEVKTVTITIPSGSDSEEIAKMLIKAGVKTDHKTFEKAVDELRAQRKFQVGTFTVPVEGDIRKVIDILTHRPNAGR